MTDFLIAGRGAGKTHRLLEMMFDDPDLVYVSHSAAAADWASEQFIAMAETRGLTVDGDFVREARKRFLRHYGSGYKPRKIVVDNVELLLARILSGAEIVTVTGTGTASSIRPILTEGTPE